MSHDILYLQETIQIPNTDMGKTTEGQSNVHEYIENSEYAHFICGSEEVAHPAVLIAVPPPTHYSSVLWSSVVCCMIVLSCIVKRTHSASL